MQVLLAGDLERAVRAGTATGEDVHRGPIAGVERLLRRRILRQGRFNDKPVDLHVELRGHTRAHNGHTHG